MAVNAQAGVPNIELHLSEMARIMRVGARALVMFYIADRIAVEQFAKHEVDLWFLRTKRFKRASSKIGWKSERGDTFYDEEYVRGLSRLGLNATLILKGGWTGRPDRVTGEIDWFEDQVIFTRI